ncbi:hypothetical protein CP532_0406 [Ophiocordyceps camponoti-leonardi (nom. inval.)]|nr:hypothetical protein CP532_0406 [Ophiocordyceps camponoti-leonardi (nom. inval.)]
MDSQVLGISIRDKAWFDEAFGSLITDLRSNEVYQSAEDSTSALRLLSQKPGPLAVLISSDELVDSTIPGLKEAVLDYVFRGGLAIAMGNFPNFEPWDLDTIERFYAEDVPSWKSAYFTRKLMRLTRATLEAAGIKQRPQQPSHEASSPDNVLSGDMQHRNEDGDDENHSVAQSGVVPPENADKPGQAAAALAKDDEGKLG